MDCIELVRLNQSQAWNKGRSWLRDPSEDTAPDGHTSTIFSFHMRATKFCSGGRKWPAGHKFETPALNKRLSDVNEAERSSVYSV